MRGVKRVGVEEDLSPYTVRTRKLEALRAHGVDPYEPRRFDVSAKSGQIEQDYDGFEGRTVKIAGRVMAIRKHGRA
ncbi:MAG: lysine--tRNA ligase, partial [Firmicutes bacterium]|nr:lysine--tRNA ligase [Bacillota bacterium]